MTDRSVFAVFLHQPAIEALGAAIKPYLVESPAGPHLQCVEIDSGGALFEMRLVGKDEAGKTVEVDLMLPIAMIKLVLSVRRDGEFGFGLRKPGPIATPAADGVVAAPSTVAPGAAAT